LGPLSPLIASGHMPRPWMLFLALPCCLGGQPPSIPTIASTTSEVLVDFVARDKHGQIVRDLRPEEVQIFEDDVRQQIRGFAFFDKGATSQSQSRAAESAPTAGAPSALQDLRGINVVTAVFAGPIKANTDNGAAARDLLRDFLAAGTQSNTYIGVFVLNGGFLYPVLPYTNDPAQVGPAFVQAVNELSGKRGTAGSPADASKTPSAVRAATDRIIARLIANSDELAPEANPNTSLPNLRVSEHEVDREARGVGLRKLFAIKRLVEAQAELPGRKLLFYVGEGLWVDPDHQELLRATVSAANRASVTIYGIDLNRLSADKKDLSELDRARYALNDATRAIREDVTSNGTAPVRRDQVMAFETVGASFYLDPLMNLENLAQETGGALIGRTNDLRTPMRRAMEDMQSHYETSYAPIDAAENGRFRHLRVAVSRPGVSVSARSGYYALPSIDGEPILPYEYAPLQALNAAPRPADLEFHAAAMRFRPGAEVQHAMVLEAPLRRVAVEPDGKGKAVKAHLSFLALIRDSDGHVVDRVGKDLVYPAPNEAALHSGVATVTAPFRLPSGRYFMESAVVDRISGKAGTRRTSLIVEPASGLALSDLTLTRGVEAADAGTSADPFLTKAGRVIPQLQTETRAGEDLGFYAVVYPSTPSAGALLVTLELLQDGRTVGSKSFAPPGESGPQPMLAKLPTKDLKAGQYFARLTVRQGQVSRQKLLPVTLVERD